MSFNLYGPFWLLTLWAYERFPPLAPAPNSGEGILRGERYGDVKGPQKSTGWYFKIINSKEYIECRPYSKKIFAGEPFFKEGGMESMYHNGHLSRRCLKYLRMVTPSHIFGVPQKDMGRGTFGKTSIDEKKALLFINLIGYPSHLAMIKFTFSIQGKLW